MKVAAEESEACGGERTLYLGNTTNPEKVAADTYKGRLMLTFEHLISNNKQHVEKRNYLKSVKIIMCVDLNWHPSVT